MLCYPENIWQVVSSKNSISYEERGAGKMTKTLITNARIIDGSGSPWFRGSVLVEGDSIAAVGSLQDVVADVTIDAGGTVLAPGFIDIHTHSDIPLLADFRGMSHITQGVTTNVIGNCGNSAAPLSSHNLVNSRAALKATYPDLNLEWTSLGDYLGLLESRGVSLNVIPLVGQGTVRGAVMGFADRQPTEEELDQMRRLVAEAMEQGAFGLSSGLIYVPGVYAATEEVVELARVAARHGGIYASHIRGENDTLLDAVAEAIYIGEATGIPVQIAHFKAMGRHMWGTSVKTLRMVEEARERGVQVTCDQYPYNASATGLAAYLPTWAHVGGKDQLLRRLRDAEERAKMTREILEGTEDWVSCHKGVGWDNTLITRCNDCELEGLSVSKIAELRGIDEFETAYDLLIENDGQVQVVYFTIGDADLERIMAHPAVMIGSDSSAVAIDGPTGKGKPHPRALGTFTRVLGHYVRGKGTITLESAVHKMTAFPAQTLGLFDRGLVRPGMKADLVVFDPDTVADRATYTDPWQYAVGIKHVLVNGVLTYTEKAHTGAKAGRVLKRK